MHGRPVNPSSGRRCLRQQGLQPPGTTIQTAHNHHQRIYSQEAIDASSKLLDINPEILTAWNYRKLAFQHNLRKHRSAPFQISG
ncbi:hypothetical protein HPP92_012998 [Vanilla planifolia]|uniref:Uncharacterized protein n=1 Tax=Vanilla planifolia TaxID=51239 RepID=A0A835QT86_VANPL|nr:hypothetical protein HPP92_012998 [Vanilla planifolia]